MHKPSISVVIPAYNSAAFLPKAVDSILKQSIAVDEIIVVDDGSSDNTLEIAQSLGEKVRCLSQSNAGPSAARNRGIESASGELIAFLDADDQWTERKIEHQLNILNTWPELALIAADMAEINPQGDILVPSVLAKHQQLEQFSILDGKPIPNALRQLTETNFIPTGTVLVKRDALIKAGLFNLDIHYGEDLELWCKIAMQHPISCLPEIGMLRCQHGDNATGHVIPLLRDLTKVMSNLRSHGSTSMQNQGIDPDALVARAWADLGYGLFIEGDFKQASMTFKISLAEQFSSRALTYRVATLLPPVVIRSLRRAKQLFTDDNNVKPT